MSEELIISTENKLELYEELYPQIEALLSGEKNKYANMANLSAVLKTAFNWLWVGFYLVDSEDELVLGPFQGPIACTRIKKGKGVCGKAWLDHATQIVPNVDEFPGHIACSSLSKSEIVIPIFLENKVEAILDIDSEDLNSFDDTDKLFLEKICKFLASTFTH